MDANLFLSILCLASALIAGIFGATLIFITVSLRNAFQGKRRLARGLLAKAKAMKGSIADLRFEWVNRIKRERELRKILENIGSTKETLSPEDYYLYYNFSIYEDRNVVAAEIKKLLDKVGAEKGLEKDVLEKRFPQLYSDLAASTKAVLEKEETHMDAVISEADAMALEVSDVVREIKGNPESSPVLSALLLLNVALFVVGVLGPLYFLVQGFQASLRSMVPLAAVSLIFFIIMVICLFVNIKLKYPELLIQKLKEFSSINYYSNFLSNMAANLALLKSKSKELL
jgi:hypothetical protein